MILQMLHVTLQKKRCNKTLGGGSGIACLLGSLLGEEPPEASGIAITVSGLLSLLELVPTGG